MEPEDQRTSRTSAIRRAIPTELVDDNVRNRESLTIVTHFQGYPWGDRSASIGLREAAWRIRLLLIYCDRRLLDGRFRISCGSARPDRVRTLRDGSRWRCGTARGCGTYRPAA